MKKLFYFLCILPNLLFGQKINWEAPLGTVELPNVDLVSMDSRDQIFASTSNGDIYLFSKLGEQINFFSPPRQAKLHQLEASRTVNIFSFSADLQEYRILDRFLNPLVKQNFPPNDVILPKAATLGNNNIIWVYDESDLSLKSFNYLLNQLIQSQPLNLILATNWLNILDLKEYKNQVFLSTEDSGLIIMDNQANLLQRINIPPITRLSINREMVFWIQDQKLFSYDFATAQSYEWGETPVKNAQFIHFGQEILAFQSDNQVHFFSIPSELKNWD